MFLLSWTGHAYSEWNEYKEEAKTHNEEISTGTYLTRFMRSTLENWQSEFLQLFTMVVLTAHLSHKGSPESKDSEEKSERALARIEKKVEMLTIKRAK